METVETSSTNILEWTTHDVCKILQAQGFDSTLLETFKEQGIDGQVLVTLSESDLKEMNLSLKLGPKKKLFLFIKELDSINCGSLVTISSVNQNSNVPVCHTDTQVTTCSDLTELSPSSGLVTNSVIETDVTQGAGATCVTTAAGPSTNSLSNVSTTRRLPDFLRIASENLWSKKFVETFLLGDQKFMEPPDRINLVHVAAQFLVNSHGYWPSSLQKSEMAAAMVKAFPCLGIVNDEGIVSHSHYYDPKSGGFLEAKLKTMRKPLPYEERKRKSTKPHGKRKAKPNGISSEMEEEILRTNAACSTGVAEVYQAEVDLMKTLAPSIQNREQITNLFASTFFFRRKQMKSVLSSPTLVLKEYPRIVDTSNGRLILDEFNRIYPKAKDVETFYVSRYQNRIAKMMDMEGLEKPDSNNEFLSSLISCLQLLPEIKKVRRASFESKQNQLIVFVDQDVDLEDYVKNRPKSLTSIKQPFLLVTGSLQSPLDYFLVIEDIVIPLGTDCIAAFKTLFSSFFVFELHYPTLIKPFYRLFEERVYRIGEMSASSADFVSRLESIPI